MNKWWLGFTAMLKKELIMMLRYFVNSLGGIITLYLVFMLIFMGYRGLAGSASWYGEGLTELVVGYITWMLMMVAYQVVPYTVLQEAQEGTLEQMYMSPLGFVPLMGFKLIASVIVDMVIVVLMLVLLVLTTGRSLNLDILSLLPLIMVALAGVAGLGFLFGGITMLFKRIQSYLQIVQFGLIGLVAAPPSLAFFRWLPVTLPSHWLRQVMVYELHVTAIPAADWLTMLSSALASLALGVLVFKLCEGHARRRGILGHF